MVEKNVEPRKRIRSCLARPEGARGIDDGNGAAGEGVDRALTRIILVFRTASAAVACVIAVIGLAPPADAGLTYAAAGGLLAWVGLFAMHFRRPPMREMLVVADAAVVIMLCLAYMRLVPAELAAASSGTSWVDLLASVSVFTVQFGLRQPAGAAVGLVIVAAHTVGRGGFGEAGVVLILQVLLAATISLTLRRAGRAADVVLAEAAQQRSLERAREATRADEREQQRRMHDTVLATLTMVSTGVIGGESDALRRRASDDLMVLEAVRVQPVGGLEPGEKIRLDVLLRDGVIRKFPRLRVALDLAPVTVPAEIAETLTACVDEALRNVGRHAGTTNVRLSTESMRDGAVVTVSDDGAGFEPAKVSPGRRGLRESILGRIRAAGGAADVVTAPGAGTTIVMRWPDG